MKVIKPQRLSVLHRVVEHKRRYTMVVTVLVYAPIDEPKRLCTEQALWSEVAAPLGGIVDEAFPKPRGEMLVTGFAFAPASGPAKAVMARAKLGSIDKKLAVFGDRFWDGSKPSEPKPFDKLPIDWTHAFGGHGFAQNPLGMGIEPIDTDKGKLHVLPNVEDPRHLIVDRKDRPAPAGFGPYDLTWPQRFSKVGHYGGDYREKLFPGMAEDFDADFYLRAPADQQLKDGFFQGDEEIAIEGMHPDKPTLAAKLERLVVRAFVSQKTPESEAFRAIGTRLDTVHLLPHLDRMVLSFRGVLPVGEDDGDDIAHLVIAAEDPTAPRDVEHYSRVLEKRSRGRKHAALLALRDEDLMPPAGAGWTVNADPGDVGRMVAPKLFALENAERGRRRKIADERDKLRARGLDPDKYLPEPAPFEPPPDPFDVDAVLAASEKMQTQAEKAKSDLEDKRHDAEREARARFEAAGRDFDAEQEQARKKAAGPPKFSADEQLGQLHDLARQAAERGKPNAQLERDLSDPSYAEMLHDLEERQREGYRRFAHHRPGAVVAGDVALARRALVVAAKDSGESLRERDLSGADLHGLDLSGMSLSGAFLEGAFFSGAVLRDADLSRAVLARANLAGADLSGAKLTGANLGAAQIENANLEGAALDGATLGKATLDGARLAGATLSGCDFFETRFASADLSGAEGEKLKLLGADLRKVTFAGARLHKTMFIACDCDGCDFTGCDLAASHFVASRGAGACFAGATLDGAVFVAVDADLGEAVPRLEASFARAVFAGASLKHANFRGMDLRGGDFSSATLDGADFSKADLRGAKMAHAKAKGAMLMRTDLRGANLRGIDLFEALASKADLRGADLSGCNLSYADVSLVRVDRATKIEGALTVRTRVDPRRPIEETSDAGAAPAGQEGPGHGP